MQPSSNSAGHEVIVPTGLLYITGFPIRTGDNTYNFKYDVRAWCEENFHAGYRVEHRMEDIIRDGFVTGGRITYILITEDANDALLFKLRWI